ncbi:twin-arginine translocase subunit TatB [bacterium]|nr:twin-arginine translocase subunit TatB [candidate division CSSED10-310 bacterium]
MGFQEILVLLIIALIVFGPKRLPDLARHLGRLTGQMRRLAWEFRSALEQEASEADGETGNEQTVTDVFDGDDSVRKLDKSDDSRDDCVNFPAETHHE